ncbi:MAG: adenylate/guanylate cyclase domain-containing protein [Desulfobacteraceae bacterium]
MNAQPADLSGEGMRARTSPQRSIQKVAVLFTDVVASSRYFKERGDLAGREMLRRHQDIASRPVLEHGGEVVKVLGDSVMAYFIHPEEALKAAIKIQEGFKKHNGNRRSNDQIHVRIAAHYGDGIIENSDVYGDVVNTAAKLLPLAKGDQVLVSGELRERVRGLTWAAFEPLDAEATKGVLDKLSIFRVGWDQNADLVPSLSTVVVFRPAWNLAAGSFKMAWEGLLEKRKVLWPKMPSRQAVLPDGCLILYLKDAAAAPILAQYGIDYLRKELGRDALPFLPVFTVIDTGPFLRAGKPSLECMNGRWEGIAPGEVHISPHALEATIIPEGFSVEPPAGAPAEGGFHRLVKKDEGQNQPGVLFLYQAAMDRGRHPPCFYCGDRRHQPAECPSKHLPETTYGLDRLGYYPIDHINELFLEFLNRGGAEPGGRPQEAEARTKTPHDLAFQAYFELKRVYQLRFLRLIWTSDAEDWDKLETTRDENEKGGLVWIGQDCIRVSNLHQAETVLMDAQDRYPDDYRTHCALGFLYVEKNNLSRAKRHFDQALEQADTVPKKIFGHFLLARCFELEGELRKAEEHIKRILFFDPNCQEAAYQEAVYKFRKGKDVEALRRVIKLAEGNRRYFMVALIDPELKAVSDKVHPELAKLLDQACKGAAALREQAQEELYEMERLLGAGDGSLETPRSHMAKIKELSTAQSYFSCLDVIHYATALIRSARRSQEQSRLKLTGLHMQLAPRLEKCRAFIEGYSYPSLLGSLPGEVASIQSRVQELRQIIRGDILERFKEAFTQAQALSSDLDSCERKMKRLAGWEQAIRIGLDFGKKALLLESVNVVVALLLFPLLGHYLSFFVPGLDTTPDSIWSYQKGVLAFGGVLGLVLAGVLTARTLSET